MIEFIAIDKTGECKPLKVQELIWETRKGKTYLFFSGQIFEDTYNPNKPKVCSGFHCDNEESKWMLCQIIKQ